MSTQTYSEEQLMDMLREYRRQITPNGDFTFRFSDYAYEIILGLLGLFLGGYIITQGMTILGIGIMILFFTFILLYHSYKKARSSIPWPPVLSPCPNAYYLNINATETDSTNTVCSPLPGTGNEENFSYPKDKRTEGCSLARTQNIDWDGC
jgi:hypothetical protein